ncbi:MAG: NAD+ synthase [Actinomycetales bacterium]
MPISDSVKLRVAAAQINPLVGDIAGNSKLILESATAASKAGVQVLVFPEMIVTGYPVEDLALRKSFSDAAKSAVEEIAKELTKVGAADMLVAVGYLDQRVKPLNALALIHQGKIVARYFKRHLPNYGVFDEFRNFESGDGTMVVRFQGVDIAVAICEDIWREEGPMAELAVRKPNLLLVPNGSPYERAKDDIRLALLKERAKQVGAPIIYANMVGGQDDLVFDGDSLIVSATGQVVARSPQFKEDLLIVDLETKAGIGKPDLIISEQAIAPVGTLPQVSTEDLPDEKQIWEALKLGLKDYVKKNNLKSVIIGLSGGIDSALVATLAVDALGKEAVYGVSMPSKYSSDHSKSDAAALAKNLGINLRTIEIEPAVSAYLKMTPLAGVAEENVQARVRGTLLMGISNQEGHLVLATGNKSELAVGYSTLYGDAVGGFAPIKDLFKTDVWRLAKWRNAEIGEGVNSPIPENSITKEPSAELRPGQIDRDSLPDYLVLDQILNLYIDQGGDAPSIIASGFEKALVERVIKMVDGAEYKRRQYPPGTKVSKVAFGKDRRLPMTSRWREGS